MTNASSLSTEDLFKFAERESGGYGLADEGLRSRVAKLVDYINSQGPYTADRTQAIRRQLQGILVPRLRLEVDRNLYPAISDEKIERPIFIVGFPRSGTTFLHSLLAEDPEVLSPRSWHSHTPSPPPGAGPVCSGRIASATRSVEAYMDFCPGSRVVHPYMDKGAYQLIEDEEIFTLDFRNAYPTILYKAPVTPAMTLLGPDAPDAFRFHRRMLQNLQWNTGKHRWTCKEPSGQRHLHALFEIYPDALCVWTHRPIGEIYSSSVTFRSVVYDAIHEKPLDYHSQARQAAQGMKDAVDRMLGDPLLNDPRIIHIPFHELSSDPVAVIRKIYARRGLDVSAAFEKCVRTWLADPDNRVDRYGRHPYAYEPLGLDKKWVQDLFSNYSKHFGLVDRP